MGQGEILYVQGFNVQGRKKFRDEVRNAQRQLLIIV